ncbi:MAG: hypothetical protein WB774_18780 [Xanthobacteraceae bacterium]
MTTKDNEHDWAPGEDRLCFPHFGKIIGQAAARRHELFATLGLAISLVVALTAVSIGMASAHAPLMQILYRS